MTEELRKKFKNFLLNKNRQAQKAHYSNFTTFVIENLEDFFKLTIIPKENISLTNHYLFNFASRERTYINENLCHYDKIEVLLERAEIGDLLFFKQDTSKKNISNIGFYIGDLKMLYFDNQHKKVCVTNLNENTKLTSSLVGIKNIENFSRTIQPPEKTK